jgi:hypothetical protein
MQIKKAIVLVLGLGAEITVLFFLAEKVFWEAYWRTGRTILRLVERYIHSEAAAWIMLEALFLITLAAIILLIKFKFLRNPYIIVFIAWFFFLMDGLASFCLLLPFMHKG